MRFFSRRFVAFSYLSAIGPVTRFLGETRVVKDLVAP